MNGKNRIKGITEAAVSASVYVVLTYLTNLMGLSSGMIQCRFSEALCILPAFTPSAIPGLFIGCFISNLLCGGIVLDIVFGSIATLIGAVGTRLLSKKCENVYLYTLPAILSNTIIVPFVLKYAYSLDESIVFFFLTVGVGEVISCGVFGTMLYRVLKRNETAIFKR